MERFKLTPHRSRILIALMVILGAVFVVRLFYLQVVMHGYYESEADKEHTSKFTIAAKRGLIYAHDGTSGYAPLVLNEPVYTVFADPRYVKNPDQVADAMRKIAGGNILNNFEDGLRDKTKEYVVLARNVSEDQANLIKQQKLSGQGIGLQQESKRVYPEDQLAAQVLGFVNGEGQGQYGIEEGMNAQLAGKDGQLKAVTDVHGIPISVGSQSVQTPAQDGKNVVLTIDRNVQNKAEQALAAGLKNAKATKGSVVVMDPNNGHILAMANAPTYNPNDFSKVTDYSVFQNRAISDPYEPGSVIKALTMGVGLNENRIQPNTTYNNVGYVKVDDAIIKNVETEPKGTVTMTQVLQYSFNTGVVWVLKQLGDGSDTITMAGKQMLYNYYTKHYLFGQPTGIELAGEVSGIVPQPTASNVQYANMTFGQGINISMLQVMGAFSADINGGTYYTPQVVDGYRDNTNNFTSKAGTIRESNVINPTASAKLRQMLHDAREGSPANAGEKAGYYIGGKTGTAQVYNPKLGQYDPVATIGSYLGFGGQDKPQYVIMVRVDDATVGGFAGTSAAAPIFTDISNWMLDYLQIAPKG